MGDVSVSIQRIKLNNTMDFSCPPSPPPCQYIFPSYFIKCQQVNSSHAGTSVSQKGNVHISLAPLNSEHHQGCVKVTKEARGRGHFLRKTPFGQRGRKITGGVHPPPAPRCSSFWSCFSSFEMFTRCIIRNWPFKWKTGMSNLYLSYQTEFSGSVISTSCKINLFL